MTDHVRAEITKHYRDQLTKLERALVAGELAEIKVTAPDELQTFGQLDASNRLGAGECSAIAVAVSRHLPLAIDDKSARKQALAFSAKLVLLDTESLMVSLIHEAVIDVAAADALKLEWEQKHRFKLNFRSFAHRM